MCKYTEVDMKVLVIPDVHLKPVMFQQATILMMKQLILQRNSQKPHGATEIMI